MVFSSMQSGMTPEDLAEPRWNDEKPQRGPCGEEVTTHNSNACQVGRESKIGFEVVVTYNGQGISVESDGSCISALGVQLCLAQQLQGDVVVRRVQFRRRVVIKTPQYHKLC